MTSEGLTTRSHDTWRWMIAGLVLALCLAPISGFAQDDEAADQPVEEVPVEVVPTVPPPPPTEAPPPPTEAPLPTAVPTEVPAYPTEGPVDSTEEPVDPTEVPTETPTETPTPTVEPAVLSHVLAQRPICNLAPSQAATLAVGEAFFYDCTDEVVLAGTNVTPASVGVTWTIRADVAGGWTVRLLPPVNDPSSETTVWTEPGFSDTWFEFAQRDPLGTSTEPVAIDQVAAIAFRMMVERTACTETTHSVRVRHAINVTSLETEISAAPQEQVEPLRLEPAVAPLGEPVVSFAGGLDFGQAGVSAEGVSDPVRTGQLNLSISGLNTACGEWTLTLRGSDLTDADGQILAGSMLAVTAVDGIALSGGPCDLTTGCTLATYKGGPNATTASLALTVELRLPEQASIGAFQTTLDAALVNTGSSQSSAAQPQPVDPVDP